MKRYAALLRGVSPMNLKMADLKRALELDGLRDVKTIASSGNVVFSAKPASNAALQRKVEAALLKHNGKSFQTFVRPISALRALLDADVFAQHTLKPQEKRVVTFVLDTPKATKLKLPITLDEARILAVEGSEIYSVYVSGPKGPVFMTLIEKTFGKEVTTRTWGAIEKITKAGEAVKA